MTLAWILRIDDRGFRSYCLYVVARFVATVFFPPDYIEMRETRHEETKTRSPGTGSSTWLSSRYRRTLQRDVSLSDTESKVVLDGRLARSHGRQGGYRVITVSLDKRNLRIAEVSRLYPSSFKPQGCWLYSLTRITYLSKLIGISSLAAYLQLEC